MNIRIRAATNGRRRAAIITSRTTNAQSLKPQNGAADSPPPTLPQLFQNAAIDRVATSSESSPSGHASASNLARDPPYITPQEFGNLRNAVLQLSHESNAVRTIIAEQQQALEAADLYIRNEIFCYHEIEMMGIRYRFAMDAWKRRQTDALIAIRRQWFDHHNIHLFFSHNILCLFGLQQAEAQGLLSAVAHLPSHNSFTRKATRDRTDNRSQRFSRGSPNFCSPDRQFAFIYIEGMACREEDCLSCSRLQFFTVLSILASCAIFLPPT